MTNRPSDADFVNFHVTCLQGSYFNTRSVGHGWLTAISDLISDYYYNFLTPLPSSSSAPLNPPSFDRLLAAERSPAIYLTPLARAVHEVSLADAGLERVAADAWLGRRIAAAPAEPLPTGVSLVQSDPSEVDDYLHVFDAAYSGAGADDPYGNLEPGYRESLRRSLTVSPPFGFRRYDLLLRNPADNTPASIGAVYVSGTLAGIYGIGTDPTQRKQGYGETVTRLLERIAADVGAEYVFLQTEAGSTVQAWYERQQYVHLFDAEYYSTPS